MPFNSDENTRPVTQESSRTISPNGKLSARKLMYGVARSGLKAKRSLLGLFSSAQTDPACPRELKHRPRNVSTPDLSTKPKRRDTISSSSEARRLLPIATLTSSTRFTLWSTTIRQASSRKFGHLIDDSSRETQSMDLPQDEPEERLTPIPRTSTSSAPTVALDVSDWGDFGSSLHLDDVMNDQIPHSSPIGVPSTGKQDTVDGGLTHFSISGTGQPFVVGGVPTERSPFDDLVAQDRTSSTKMSRTEQLTISLAGSPQRFAVDPFPTPMPGTSFAMDEAYRDSSAVPPTYGELFPTASLLPSVGKGPLMDDQCPTGGRNSSETLRRLREEILSPGSFDGSTIPSFLDPQGRNLKPALRGTAALAPTTQDQNSHLPGADSPIRTPDMGLKGDFERARADRERRYKEAIDSAHVSGEDSPLKENALGPSCDISNSSRRRTNQHSSNWGDAGLVPEYIHMARDHFGVLDDPQRRKLRPSASSAGHLKDRRRLMRSRSLTGSEQDSSDPPRSHASSHVSIAHLESLRDLYLSSIDPKATETRSFFNSPRPGTAAGTPAHSTDEKRYSYEKPGRKSHEQFEQDDQIPKPQKQYTDDPVLYDLMARIGATVDDLAEVDLIHRLLVKARRNQKMRRTFKSLASPRPVASKKARRDRHSLPAKIMEWFSRSPSKTHSPATTLANDDMIEEIEARIYGLKSNKSLDSVSDGSDITITASINLDPSIVGVPGGALPPRLRRSADPYSSAIETLPASRSMPENIQFTTGKVYSVCRSPLKSSSSQVSRPSSPGDDGEEGPNKERQPESPVEDPRLSLEDSEEEGRHSVSTLRTGGPGPVPLHPLPFTGPDEDDGKSFANTIRTALASDSEQSSIYDTITLRTKRHGSEDEKSISKRSLETDVEESNQSDDGGPSSPVSDSESNHDFKGRSPTPPAHVLFNSMANKESLPLMQRVEDTPLVSNQVKVSHDSESSDSADEGSVGSDHDNTTNDDFQSTRTSQTYQAD